MFLLLQGQELFAFTLPDNFTDQAVITGLQDPDGFAFAPDGRMFISERISGRLRIASYNQAADTWALSPTPFHTFNTPGVPRRSGGLRDIAFDPNFASNGFIYAFYMEANSLHNRVVRIRVDVSNSNVSDAAFGEQLLIDLPFNNDASSGSHNGGALEFGADGKLYITTGDGWEGEFAGDPVQSLSSFTGKVLRINPDGSIPSDNPFIGLAPTAYRSIYALGLRNPYSMSSHPDTGLLYINEARGSNKASIYIVEAAANYGHEGNGPGNVRPIWANASGAGGELITGGAWMPEAGLGNYPSEFDGRYFTALWGSNSSSTGRINTLASDADPTAQTFSTGLGLVGSNGIPVKPVVTRINGAGELYYLLTTYTTNSGQIRRVKFTSQVTAAAPIFDPVGGDSVTPISVEITSSTENVVIHFTTNNDPPNESSTIYSGPIDISQSTILRAIAVREGFNNSAETSAVYIIGDQSGNQPPNVDAGADSVRFVGQTIALDGSATTDPDGNDDFLSGELWQQLSGPTIDIQDATEEIAFITPTQPGEYVFQLTVSDGVDSSSDQVTHTIVLAPRVERGLQALYTFLEGSGTGIADVSAVGEALDMTITTPNQVTWIANGGLSIDGSADIRSGVASKVVNACKVSNAVTVEAWLETDSLLQSGPGPVRIVSLSANTTNRNFTLGQENDRFDTRLRSSETDDNGTPSITVPASTVKLELTHVVYTRAAAGAAKIYVNGQLQVNGNVGGLLDNWNNSYQLLFGNEATLDRPWFGDLFLVAVYCADLNNDEVRQNFLAGTPPFTELIDSDDDNVPDVLDNCPADPNPQQQDLDSDGLGDVCDGDRDNDGINNTPDLNSFANNICADSDFDFCDDCSVGVDGFGPLSDAQPLADGPDLDMDGLCDAGDTDVDGDGLNNQFDNCPLIQNVDQADQNNNGLGDACESTSDLCIPIRTHSSKLTVICL